MLADTMTKALMREELARHCWHRTRGAAKMLQLIEELLFSLAGAMDALGVPLLRDEMQGIW